MSAYLGYHPSFSYKKDVIERKVKDGLDYQIVTMIDENGLITKDVLIELKEELDTRYLHFLYKNLNREEAEICDFIIDSVVQTP